MSLKSLVLCSCWIAALVASPAVRADDSLPAPIYALKQPIPTVGSNIPRRVATSRQIPLNRRYEQLSAEERQLLKSRYETMTEEDEPPFPINGLQPVFEAVAEVQRKLLVRGELTMHVDIDARGEATAVKVLKSPDPALTRAVASVLMLTHYKPAVCGGKPCSMGFPFSMTFSVDL